jgi:hypothetical protein
MPGWLVALLVELVKQGATSLPQILTIGKNNGMTDEEAAAITLGYAEMESRRKADAGL